MLSNFTHNTYSIDVATFFEDVIYVLGLQKFAQSPVLWKTTILFMKHENNSF